MSPHSLVYSISFICDVCSQIVFAQTETPSKASSLLFNNMSLFLEASMLNNHGVIALSQGKYKDASQLMTQSLKLMKHDLDVITTQEDELSVESAVAVHRPENGTDDTRIQRVTIVDEGSPFQKECGLFFGQAFIIPSSDELASSSPLMFDRRNIYAASIIFNLALVHHLQHGSQQSSNSYRYLHKAEQLYGMIFPLLDDAAFSTASIALLIKLACINNLTEIRSSTYFFSSRKEDTGMDVTESEDQREEGDALERYQREQVANVIRQTSNPELFEEPEIHGLLMNALLYKVPTLAAAA